MEYYAKLVFIEKGMFRVSASIWKTDPDSRVESVIYSKKFFSYHRAKIWSEKKILKFVFSNTENAFIREKDIIRRKWND